MPLLRNAWDNQPSREPEPLSYSPSPKKRSGFFGSRRSTDHSPTRSSNPYASGTSRYSPTNPSPTHSSSGAFFSRRRSSDDASDRSLGRSSQQESSIVAARQKVADAENAERLAGDALKRARIAVREAREHIRILDKEALEE